MKTKGTTPVNEIASKQYPVEQQRTLFFQLLLLIFYPIMDIIVKARILYKNPYS
jgi:hypothetical protein